MITQMPSQNATRGSEFPLQEVRRRLQGQLQQIADDGALIRPEWEPLLDSKRVVGTVLSLEGLFRFRIPPDKVVRRGGYNDVEEALEDMADRIKAIWTKRKSSKVRR